MARNSQGKGSEEDDVSSLEDASGFGDVLSELDKEERRIVVRLELRKFRKPTTVVEGLGGKSGDMRKVARKLKHSLATGGTAKDGIIILQGDQRERTREELARLGYPESRIEVQ